MKTFQQRYNNNDKEEEEEKATYTLFINLEESQINLYFRVNIT